MSGNLADKTSTEKSLSALLCSGKMTRSSDLTLLWSLEIEWEPIVELRTNFSLRTPCATTAYIPYYHSSVSYAEQWEIHASRNENSQNSTIFTYTKYGHQHSRKIFGASGTHLLAGASMSMRKISNYRMLRSLAAACPPGIVDQAAGLSVFPKDRPRLFAENIAHHLYTATLKRPHPV